MVNHRITIHKASYVLLLAVCLTPVIGSGTALMLGFLFTALFGNPLREHAAKLSKWALKCAVIGLGFSVDVNQVLQVGRDSIVLTLVSITAIIGLGEILTQWLRVARNTGLLISFGTAICGGSAIAAMAPVIKAKDDEIAVALAIVFALNALALFIFPVVGHYFNLTEQQFAYWAALAIHDTSSVVAASASFGAASVALATTIKLTRAMWIIPYTAIAGVFWKSEERASIPLFIVGFVLAALVNSEFPQYQSVWSALSTGAKHILIMTLFLIGSGMSLQTLKQVGPKPFLMAIILWIIVSSLMLLMIIDGVI
ncbi:hypothetical protein B1199_15460 [Pseudoalteromonas ulvae]|uniref:Sulfate exporter family transporter n=2 Tax=Pseudoalteromonas ulvae TaxID=107327 RepID=A0A244CMD2_PSEDV|nr:putative sulfate exporter family transporter [Pseudoalteromonas ulvae]OUL56770.1 hypothetical protein B1199_15460 [Pseudoalteromonas ulvae]